MGLKFEELIFIVVVGIEVFCLDFDYVILWFDDVVSFFCFF